LSNTLFVVFTKGSEHGLLISTLISEFSFKSLTAKTLILYQLLVGVSDLGHSINWRMLQISSM